jgi:hypothetical protein
MDRHSINKELTEINNLAIKGRKLAEEFRTHSECPGCVAMYDTFTDIINKVVDLNLNIYSSEEAFNPSPRKAQV